MEWSSKTLFPMEELELLQSQIDSVNAKPSRVLERVRRHVAERNSPHLGSRQAVIQGISCFRATSISLVMFTLQGRANVKKILGGA